MNGSCQRCLLSTSPHGHTFFFFGGEFVVGGLPWVFQKNSKKWLKTIQVHPVCSKHCLKRLGAISSISDHLKVSQSFL